MILKSNLVLRFTGCCLSISLVGLSSGPAFPDETYRETPGVEGNGNFVVGPDYTIDPDLTDRGNPKGKYFEFAMRLADSKIFRGDDSTLTLKRRYASSGRYLFTCRQPTRMGRRRPF